MRQDGQWVDPYEYFKVNDIAELYPHLRKAKPVKMEVTPVAYDNNGAGQVDITNSGTFIIDLEKGATTTYSTSYYEHPYYGNEIHFDLTLTFVGNPDSSDLMTVSSSYTEYAPWGSEPGSMSDCIIFNYSVDGEPDYAKRGLIIDNGTYSTVAFVINKILLP